MKFLRLHSPLLAVLSALLIGCGDGQPVIEVAPVTGVVTQAGQPVSDASITFYPASGRPSAATTNSEGRFELKYSADKAGAVVGSHTVAIQVGGGPPAALPGMPPAKKGNRRKGPPSDMETIEWDEKIEVKQGENEFTFDLK